MLYTKRPKFYTLRYAIAMRLCSFAVKVAPYPYNNLLRRNLLNYCSQAQQLQLGDHV